MHISAPGEKPPSTATLMNRYEAPHARASREVSGQYLRVTWEGRRTCPGEARRERGARQHKRSPTSETTVTASSRSTAP